MMSGLETLFEFFSISNSEAVSIAVGFVLSPAKALGLVYGLYKAMSLNYNDTTWKEFIESRDD